MPSSRAILSDIVELKLNPMKAYRHTDSLGKLKNRVVPVVSEHPIEEEIVVKPTSLRSGLISLVDTTQIIDTPKEESVVIDSFSANTEIVFEQGPVLESVVTTDEIQIEEKLTIHDPINDVELFESTSHVEETMIVTPVVEPVSIDDVKKSQKKKSKKSS